MTERVMQSDSLDLGQLVGHEACEREPIHIPGSIQPYGLLCVVDEASDLVMQAAGDAGRLIGFDGAMVGHTCRDLLGVSLRDLVRCADTVLLREPVFLGNVGPFGNRSELAIAAHELNGVTVVEALPSMLPPSSAQTLARIRSITQRIGGALDLIKACELAAAEVSRISGYDRVLVYKFHPDGSGSVIAEVNDGGLPQLINHRFPASDIPAQARQMYCRNAFRIIPDVSYTPAPLVPALFPLTHRPLDMSHCLLRSVSPIHIQYLKNMGVSASLSVSLLSDLDLWGLIIAHNATSKILPYEAQEACRHVGQILSQQVRARDQTELYQLASDLSAARDSAMRPLLAAEDCQDPLPTLLPELTAIVPSDGAAIACNGTVMATGRCPTKAQLIDLAAWLSQRAVGDPPYVTDHLSDEYPSAKAFAAEASGLLAIRPAGDDEVIIMWFRPEQVQDISWAGNLHQSLEPAEGAPKPRQCFATWREKLHGHSRPWQAIEIESAEMLSPRLTVVLQRRHLRELNRLLGGVNEQLANLASLDGLTGLANRRTFDERLQIEWARARRTNRPLALLILDVDYFKRYNDHYGHAFGDACLKQVSQCLQEARRASDLAARIGGEEFSLILPDTDLTGAAAVAEGLRARVEALHLPHAASPLGILTACVGVAALADGMASAHDLMHAADKALYLAKADGRNLSVAA